MTYIDGFVIKMPKKNVEAYKKMARLGRKVWMKHGALQYVEAIGDDLAPSPTGPASRVFPKLVKAGADDVVFFSFIVFKNKAHRDRVNKKVMADPAMNDPNFDTQSMPFEMKDMSYGGFKSVVEA